MFRLPPLFALGLTNLPMLGWLAAAAVPILIHLWTRRRYREVSWAAMEYLTAAVRQQARRLRLEQWLLLAIRTLLVVFIVLAVCEPYTERAGFALSSGGPTHRVLVIDASYSMAYQPASQSCFDRAKALARRIVEESPHGDVFSLVVMASPPRVLVGESIVEPSEAVREIDAVELSHTTTDLPATVEALTSLVRNARREKPRITRHEAYFLTDLQRVTWAPTLSQAAKAELLRRTDELAKAASLTVIDLGQPGAENLAITDLRTLEPALTTGQPAALEAHLQQFGPQARAGQSVELWVDGRRIERKVADVPANGEATVGFTCRLDTPGDHAIEVRAPGDALEIDNRRYLIVPVRESIRALCIDGCPSGTPFHGAADYLALALSPQEGRADHAMIQAKAATEGALSDRNLADYDCVLLCNVAQFTAGEVGVLDAYLKSGGSLVFFVGDQVMADRYHRQLGVAASEENASAPRILPARLVSVVDNNQFAIDPLEYRHPIVQAFRGKGESALLTTPVFRYFKLEVPKDSPAKIALALTNGDPLIVEQPVHGGRVVLVATSCDASWTAMPLWTSFVPLVHEIVTWCVGSQSQRQNVVVGEPSFVDTTHSGIFTLPPQLPVNRTQRIAVNVDTAESDLARLDSNGLRSETWPGISFACQTSWQVSGSAGGAGPLHARASLSVALLYVALGLLFLETLLAWRFGHHAT